MESFCQYPFEVCFDSRKLIRNYDYTQEHDQNKKNDILDPLDLDNKTEMLQNNMQGTTPYGSIPNGDNKNEGQYYTVNNLVIIDLNDQLEQVQNNIHGKHLMNQLMVQIDMKVSILLYITLTSIDIHNQIELAQNNIQKTTHYGSVPNGNEKNEDQYIV